MRPDMRAKVLEFYARGGGHSREHAEHLVVNERENVDQFLKDDRELRHLGDVASIGEWGPADTGQAGK